MSKALAKRPDAPRVYGATRGSLQLALSSGAAENREDTLEWLKADEFAPSGKRPRASRWRTWQRLHRNWLPHQPTLPLTPDSISVVLAQLKRGGYRSAADYMSTAKDKHLQTYPWSHQLARAHKASVRAALRGIGPSHQCAEVDPIAMAKAAKALEGKDDNLPAGFHFTIIIASFFVLREIELSTMIRGSVKLDKVALTVTINLPASKTDWMALSCQRSWGCVCLGEFDAMSCPYHAMEAQLSLLVDFFGDEAKCDEFPVAPSKQGKVMTKESVVRSIQAVAMFMGLEMTAPDGRDAITGHVWRISGSRMLARLGIIITLIMLLARWGSGVIIRYVKDAPLHTLSADYKRAIVGKKAMIKDQPSTVEKLPSQVLDKVKKVLDETKAIEEKLTLEIDGLAAQLKDLQDDVNPLYVVSEKYNQWHRTRPWRDLPRSEWRAWCGWPYAKVKATVDRRKTFKDGVDVCGRCFPELVDHDGVF